MKKIICTVLIFVMLLFSLCSCKMRYLPVYGEVMNDTYFVIQELPRKEAGGETTLEFWIGEIVEESDYEGHAIVYNGFLGEGYSEDVLLGAHTTDYYVHYTVDNYPKVDSETSGILGIQITDPSVQVYGLTTESSIDDFAEVFEALGAEVKKLENKVNAKLGDVSFRLTKSKGITKDGLPKINIHTNQMGIVCIN